MSITITGALGEALVAPPSPYLPINPVDSALDAIAAHFAAQPGIGSAIRGFPEHARDLDFSFGPLITLTYADDQREPCSPSPIAGTFPFLWHTGTLTIDAMLDLWTPYRAQRDDAARVVEDSLNNALPHRTGLQLVSKGYHLRALVATATGGRDTDEPEASATGEWRRTWMLTIETDLVALTNTSAQSSYQIRPTVDSTVYPTKVYPE